MRHSSTQWNREGPTGYGAKPVAFDVKPPAIDELLADAGWLAHRYNEREDSIHFRLTSRDDQRRAAFLTDEYLGTDAAQIAVARREIEPSLIPEAPIHFIFHSAFCCSTLLARAFDVDGLAMGLKEPTILNDLHGWRRRGAKPAEVGAVLDLSLALLARPFAKGEAVVVKPSCLVNLFAPAMLAMRPASRAILLRAPLRVFVGSVARKGMWGRLWVRDWLAKLAPEGLIQLGFEPDDYLRLTDLQVAAVCWLSQQALFDNMASRFGKERVAGLESETLLARPEEALAATARQFGLNLGNTELKALASGPAFRSHSKSGGQFGRSERDAERSEGEAPHQDEIDKVSVWAEAVAATAGLSLDLPAPLLA